MIGINILIACVALLGFLPMAVFIYKKKKTDRILAIGQTAQARVHHISRGIKGNYDIVNYTFLASNGRQYQGGLTTKPRLHRLNNVVEVYYLAEDPTQNTVKGTMNPNWFLAFVTLIALAVLYMMYKLYEMLNFPPQ